MKRDTDSSTYHFAHTLQSGADTPRIGVERPTVLHTVRLSNNHSIGDNHACSIPVCGHGPTERIKQVLRLLGHALSTALLAFLQSRDGSGFAVLQGANIEGVDRGVGVGERSRGIRGGRCIMRREGNELEVLDAGDGDDMVVAWRRKRRSAWRDRGGWQGGGVDRNEVRDGADGEKGSFESHGRGSSSNDADAIAKSLSVSAPRTKVEARACSQTANCLYSPRSNGSAQRRLQVHRPRMSNSRRHCARGALPTNRVALRVGRH